MNIKIYIQSSIFNTEFRHTQLFKDNQDNLFALDTATNALALENISDETILALIAEHVIEVEPQNYSEELLPFNGGMYLQAEGKKIDSNCCGDISDIDNWRAILQANNTHWEAMWIGHPEIAFKVDAENIYFSNDIDELVDGDFIIKFSFNKIDFLNKLENKLALFDKFKQQTFSVLQNSDLSNTNDLQKILF
jgi:hypothetical protein